MMATWKVLGGSGHGALAEAVAKELRCEVVWPENLRFANGELGVVVQGDFAGVRVVVVQGFMGDVQAAVMEVCLLADAALRRGTEEVVLLAPYLPYGRADKAWEGHAVGADVLAKMLAAAGIKKVITLEPHSARVAGFYGGGGLAQLTVIPQVEVFGAVVADALAEVAREVCVVAPDAGAAERASELRDALVAAWGFAVPLVVMDKSRGADGQVRRMEVSGDVQGRHVLVVDDMVDSAGTLVAVCAALREAGAAEVSMVAAHGVLSGEAVRRLLGLGLANLWLSDSLPLGDEVRVLRGLRVVGCASALGRAVNFG